MYVCDETNITASTGRLISWVVEGSGRCLCEPLSQRLSDGSEEPPTFTAALGLSDSRV